MAAAEISSVYAAAFAEEAAVVATLDVQTMWNRLLGEFLNEWTAVTRTVTDDAAIERHMQEFMDSLSDKPVEDLARQSSTIAYNEGRDAALRTAADAGLARYVVRSEVLDQSTCENCASLDSIVLEIGTPEYQELMPPARCLGGARCRGFYIPITEAA